MNTMTPEQARNLQVLTAHMDALPRTLDMETIHICGTPACAIGEAACMPHFVAQGLKIFGEDDFEFCGDNCTEHEAAIKLFGISRPESCALFGYSRFNAWGRGNVTGPEWAAKAREILAAHGYPAAPAEPAKAPERIEKPSPHLTALLHRLTVREPA